MASLLRLKANILCQHWISLESFLQKPQELLQPRNLHHKRFLESDSCSHFIKKMFLTFFLQIIAHIFLKKLLLTFFKKLLLTFF